MQRPKAQSPTKWISTRINLIEHHPLTFSKWVEGKKIKGCWQNLSEMILWRKMIAYKYRSETMDSVTNSSYLKSDFVKWANFVQKEPFLYLHDLVVKWNIHSWQHWPWSPGSIRCQYLNGEYIHCICNIKNELFCE